MLCFGPLPYKVFLAVLVTRDPPSELSSESKNATDEKCQVSYMHSTADLEVIKDRGVCFFAHLGLGN